MTSSRNWNVCVLTLSLCPCLGGRLAPVPKPVSSIVDEIFELDGTAAYLDQIREVYIADVHRLHQRGRISDQLLPRALQWVEVLFGDGSFAADYRHGFAESLDEPQAEAVLAWLRSPQVRKLYELEMDSETPDALDRINAYLKSDQGHQAIASRAELFKQYSEAVQCPQRNLHKIVALEMTRMALLNRSAPPEERLNEEELQEYAQDIEELHRQKTADGCWLQQLYTFRNVPDEELRDYYSFFDTEAGQWYMRAHHSAAIQAWSSGGARLGDKAFQQWTQKNPH